MRTIYFIAALLWLVPAYALAVEGPHPAKMDVGLPIEPDPRITPGANDPSVVDPKLPKAVLCDPAHHTSEDRAVSEADKVATYQAYGLQPVKTSKGWDFHVGYCATKQGCEVDHLCSLENGCTNDPKNRWVEPYEGTRLNAHAKDIVENRLHKLMCASKITLADDQHMLSSDWIAAWYKYVSPLPPTPAGTIDPATPKGFGQ